MVQEKATDIPKCSDVSFSKLISQSENSLNTKTEKVSATGVPGFGQKMLGGEESYLSYSLHPKESKIRIKMVTFTWKTGGDGVESF